MKDVLIQLGAGTAAAIIAGIILHFLKPLLRRSHQQSSEIDQNSPPRSVVEKDSGVPVQTNKKIRIPVETVIIIPILFLLLVFLVASIASNSPIMGAAVFFWVLFLGGALFYRFYEDN